MKCDLLLYLISRRGRKISSKSQPSEYYLLRPPIKNPINYSLKIYAAWYMKIQHMSNVWSIPPLYTQIVDPANK